MTIMNTAILTVLAIGIASVNPANAATLYVANNGLDGTSCGKTAKKACRSITRALELALDGDTIEVGPGLYGDVDADGQFTSPGDERPAKRGCDCMIHVNKPVVLKSRAGATQTLIHPGPPDDEDGYAEVGFTSLVQIDAAGVVFGEKDQGFTVASQPPALGAPGLSGIHVTEGAAGTSIGGNFVMMNERGVFSFAPGLVVSENLIQTNHVGLILAGAMDAIITDNGIQGNIVGLGMLGDDATISGNLVTGNRRFGVHIHYGTGVAISGNSVLGNGIGVNLTEMAAAAVNANNIFGNHSFDSPTPFAGLVSKATADVDASGNYFGVPTTSSFTGDEIYDLGPGNLVTTPSAAARYKIALEAMK